MGLSTMLPLCKNTLVFYSIIMRDSQVQVEDLKTLQPYSSVSLGTTVTYPPSSFSHSVNLLQLTLLLVCCRRGVKKIDQRGIAGEETKTEGEI